MVDLSPGDIFYAAENAVEELKSKYGKLNNLNAKMMLVLGSGCGEIAQKINPLVEIQYAEIPGMPLTSVAGHDGSLKIGELAGKIVLGFKGRLHYYEGNSAQQVAFPVHLAKQFGVEAAIFTSAVGIAPSVASKDITLGDLLIVKDVFPNFLPSALRGKLDPSIGARFNGTMNMNDVYLNLLAKEVAMGRSIKLQDCLYVARQGPNYETPLEVSILGKLSNDFNLPVVGGMSLVPELEAANMLEIKSLAIAVVTNKMFDLSDRGILEEHVRNSLGSLIGEDGKALYSLSEAEELVAKELVKLQPNHEEVKEVGKRADVTGKLSNLIEGIIYGVNF